MEIVFCGHQTKCRPYKKYTLTVYADFLNIPKQSSVQIA